MAACDIVQLQEDARSNGFTDLSEDAFHEVQLQLLKNISGTSLTTVQLLAAARTNGFQDLNQKSSKSAELQLLCNISEG